jgi:threonine/homoserine/homoserine lactone efflux protein
MQLILKGMALGFMLTIMVGPILISIVQTSIENGWKSGLRVACGIWLSDFLFITACYFGAKQVIEITEWSGFELTVGIVGGIILAGFGVGLLLKRTTEQELEEQVEELHLDRFTAWLRGFLINTINPFTVLFWITISLTIVGKEAQTFNAAATFYFSLMGVVMFGDAFKVFLAHKIRPWLTPKHIKWIRTVSGIAFILFGIVMVVRVI